AGESVYPDTHSAHFVFNCRNRRTCADARIACIFSSGEEDQSSQIDQKPRRPNIADFICFNHTGLACLEDCFMADIVIELQNVSYRYPVSDDYVLNDVSFTIEKGKFTAIIGNNASGKTTLCNAI